PPVIDLEKVGIDWPGVVFTAQMPEPTLSRRQFFGGVAAAGDVNGDGLADLLLAAPGWNRSEDETEVGKVFLVYGRPDFPPTVNLETSAGMRAAFRGSAKRARLGRKVLGLDDFNGDQRSDFAIAAAARIFVLHGGEARPEEVMLDDAEADSVIISDTDAERASLLAISAVKDFNGDGMSDLCVGIGGATYRRGVIAGEGCTHLILGRPDLPSPLPLYEASPYVVAIPGIAKGEELGAAVASADIDGDRRSDLLIGASASLPEGDPAGESHLYIVYGRSDLLGALGVSDFRPHQGSCAGGTKVMIRGAGFTEEARVFFGDDEAVEYERIDSASLIVRNPASQTERTVEVKVIQGGQEVIAEAEYRYSGGAIREVYEAANLGEDGIRIYEDREEDRERWIHFNFEVQRPGDVNGDGIDDVFFAAADGTPSRPGLESIYILWGTRTPPEEILMSSFEQYGSAIFTGTELDGFGIVCDALGDMNGDGRGDIISRIEPPDAEWGFLVVYGAPFGSRVDAEERVFDRGEGTFVGVERDHRYETRAAGDVNGDGYRDALLIHREPVALDALTLALGRVSLLLGGPAMPRTQSIRALPAIYGERVANEDKDFIGRLGAAWPIGDPNGDGFDDFVVEWTTTGPFPKGGQWYEVYVIFGRRHFPAETSLDEETERGGAVLLAKSTRTPKVICTDVCRAGDVNGDGLSDIFLVSKPRTDDCGPFEGAYLVYGRNGWGGGRELGNTWEFDGSFLCADGENSYLARCDAGSDFNADGRPDLLLTDRHGAAPLIPSRAYLIFGDDFSTSPVPIPDMAKVTRLEDTYGSFPRDVSFCGDVNGDGAEDVAALDGNHLYILFSPAAAGDREFRRGDVNQSGQWDIGDAILLLAYLFRGVAPVDIPCLDAADTDDSETFDLSDPMRILMLLFADGPPLAPPFEECGPDPAGDDLDCERSICP
ncbi:MAG: FG-GAP repeat protein, partial [Planctomycetes bacterium]|nr:FG-GAP repeat protein [Planctomycetota bacterium]